MAEPALRGERRQRAQLASRQVCLCGRLPTAAPAPAARWGLAPDGGGVGGRGCVSGGAAWMEYS